MFLFIPNFKMCSTCPHKERHHSVLAVGSLQTFKRVLSVAEAKGAKGDRPQPETNTGM